MTAAKIISVSVDLDGIDCYHAIHGLAAPPDSLGDAHMTAGLARFLDLFALLGIRSTLFTVGRDVAREASRGVLLRARDAGHEIANHTLDHRYDFSRLPPGDMEEQVAGGARAIEDATGAKVVGFRAPGYIVNDGVIGLLARSGYAYDASLLPSPSYHAAKAAVIGVMKARGRESRSIIGGAGMMLAPAEPYRTGTPYWRRGAGLPELPCSVLPVARVPFIGTTIALAGGSAALAMARAASLGSFVGLEFHAMDLMDARMDGLDALEPVRADVRISVGRKRRIFESVIRGLMGRGFEPMTLAGAALRLFG